MFLENNQIGDHQEAAYLYDDPLEIINVTNPSDLKNAFAQIQTALDQGFHVAGYISYEAGYWFENKLKSLMPEKLGFPLLYMGIFKSRDILNSHDADDYWREYDDATAYSIDNINLSLNRDQYEIAFNKIQDYLKSGDTYQVNFTQKASFDFKGSAKAFYSALRKAQQVEYAAYIQSDEHYFLSLSPELFIKKTGQHLKVKPMKGTSRRGRNNKEDDELEQALYNSVKEKAENLMIVDLLRNDLSKMAEKASVHVSKLFEVEKYRTLLTMTSTIDATLNDKYSALDVLASVFPCGSVTGAPKIRAMQIIEQLEKTERGIYTGAIGYFTPGGDMCFSVPIRTLTIDKSGKGELGIGGAIVADSNCISEYDECLLKAQFVTKSFVNFDLIETILYSKAEGYHFLEMHLDRMEASAQYFNHAFNSQQIIKELHHHQKFITSDDGQTFKVRLLLSPRGNISITSNELEQKPDQKRPSVVLSKEKVDSQDPMLFHKTTDREFFNRNSQLYSDKTACFDVIFLNERDELTQGSYTNIVIKKDGTYYTPAQHCGLLPGIYRQTLLESETLNCVEKVLYMEDLKSADHIYLCNAIRGLVDVKFVNQ